MAYPFPFDHKNPDYVAVFTWRMERLQEIREHPENVPALKLYYRDNPIDFIEDWGVTSDPRNIDLGLPAVIPIILFPKQREYLQWVLDRWKARAPGLAEKSRDCGLTVMMGALAASLSLFHDGFVFGFGSRKEDLVDKAGDPNCIFYKVRMFLDHVPAEFCGGYSSQNKRLSSHMHIEIPSTGAVIHGEAGDNIGRGGRASIYCVDESAFIARPHLIEASLSQTTNCRIDVSSVNGTDNPFAEKRFGGKISLFTFNWRDDPRKGDEWYAAQKRVLNPIVVAQEIDLDYSASKSGVLIPPLWVNAAIGAARKLGITPSGKRHGALDVADEGLDLNAFSSAHGIELTYLEAWSGQGINIYKTTQKAFLLCDMNGCGEFQFDSDGLGVGVRGDAEQINEGRPEAKRKVIPFRGSSTPVNPDDEFIKGDKFIKGVTNKDFFLNRKAQAWWALRTRFENTYRAIEENLVVDLADIISIPENLPERAKLVSELSQPTYGISKTGKLEVNKAPEGMASPNHADSVMILFAPQERIPAGWFG